MKLIVTDKADPSVGLMSTSYQIEVPIDAASLEELAEFKKMTIDLYSEFSFGTVVAQYDFELEMTIPLVQLQKAKDVEEYILCSAIWYKELPLIKPELLEPRGFRPYNIDKGIVFCGWRHPNCIYQKGAITGLRDAESGEKVEGFLTNLNRFVDREEGLQIAEKAQQLNNRTSKRVQLYSEDLY